MCQEKSISWHIIILNVNAYEKIAPAADLCFGLVTFFCR